MYETTPNKSNNKARSLSILLLITAFAAMMFSGIPGIPFRSVMQLISLVMLAFSILLLTRYVLSSYSYAVVSKREGGFDLTVTELKRKSRITVCRISLSSIEKITLAKSENKELAARLKALSKGKKSYNYCIDLAPEKYIHIVSNECGDELTIKLSYDKRLFSILSEGSGKTSDSTLQ